LFAYVARRLVTLIPVWIGITLLAFLLVHAVPGGPFDTGAVRSEESTQALLHFYGLDQPLWKQYVTYLGNVLQGDLGESMVRRGLTVEDVIADRFPTSLILGGAALVVAIGIGLPMGVFAAVRHNRWLDRVLMLSATVGYAIPNFVLAMLLLLLFGVTLGWLPLGGWGSPEQVILPAIALGLPWAGLVARMARASLLETLGQDYVRTAWAKGAGPARVIVRHALRNAMIPLTTVFAVLAAELITGSLVVELIFGVPGIGKYMVDSVLGADYTMTLGLIIFYATLVFLANLVADISYAWLDPRIRHG
jgi:oligopeptide transport system permease protein